MKETRRIRYLIIACYVFTVLNFVWDIYTPHGIANWVLYIPIILTPVWYNNSRHVVVAAVACSVLVIIGFFLSPPGIDYFWAVMNRVFVLTALWLTAVAAIIMSNRSVQLTEAVSIVEREIEQRKQTEKELRETEERLQLAMQGAGMGTWDVNLRTGAAIWSETHFRNLGYEPVASGEATREMWLGRVHPDDRGLVQESQERASRERSLHSAEYRIDRPDRQKPTWLAVFGRFLYDDQGEAIRFVGVSFDITRRKELESEVLRVAAREQQEIGQELHDGVGQELTGLGLMGKTLALRLPEASEDKRIATRLLAGLDQVHRKVRELSRGLIPVHVETRGLSAALDDLATRMTEQSGVSVTSECPEWVDLPDHATATQMFRITQEAVTNALRHGRPQHVRITLLSEPDGLRLRIKDDGIGIKGEPKESDGLGLRIMQYRAGLIGGVLRIKPSETEGTIVTLTLSRSRSDGEEGNGAEQDEDPHRG